MYHGKIAWRDKWDTNAKHVDLEIDGNTIAYTHGYCSDYSAICQNKCLQEYIYIDS